MEMVQSSYRLQWRMFNLQFLITRSSKVLCGSLATGGGDIEQIMADRCETTQEQQLSRHEVKRDVFTSK